MLHFCRHCHSKLTHQVIDLGHQPPSNAYLNKEQLDKAEIYYPLKVYVCTKCWLVQLPKYAEANQLFTDDYGYFSSTSISWCRHAKDFVNNAIEKLNLNHHSIVVEIASNDGYLLQYVQENNIPCFGIEPTKSTANAAKAKGIKTIESFFGVKLATSLKNKNAKCFKGVDLIVANNVLAHVPDINDFVEGISILLAQNGRASIEFPHLLKLIKGNQFDTIYHEHYSYLSLNFIQRLFEKFSLEIIDVEELKTHGGSLRVWASHKGSFKINKNVARIKKEELDNRIETIDLYKNFQLRAESIKLKLIKYLYDCKINQERVVAYGAAAKGNTLLNYAGIKSEFIDFVVDKSPGKKNKFMPGNQIPILGPESLEKTNIESLLVLPWNIKNEIYDQFNGNYNLITFIPKFEILKKREK